MAERAERFQFKRSVSGAIGRSDQHSSEPREVPGSSRTTPLVSAGTCTIKISVDPDAKNTGSFYIWQIPVESWHACMKIPEKLSITRSESLSDPQVLSVRMTKKSGVAEEEYTRTMSMSLLGSLMAYCQQMSVRQEEVTCQEETAISSHIGAPLNAWRPQIQDLDPTGAFARQVMLNHARKA